MSFDDIDKPSTSSSVFTSKVDVQQDVKVYNRIAELRSAGLWSASRLPMCVEPPRQKVHWDFLLEEVLWMSKDFAQERRIKSRLARKVFFLNLLKKLSNYQLKKNYQLKIINSNYQLKIILPKKLNDS